MYYRKISTYLHSEAIEEQPGFSSYPYLNEHKLDWLYMESNWLEKYLNREDVEFDLVNYLLKEAAEEMTSNIQKEARLKSSNFNWKDYVDWSLLEEEPEQTLPRKEAVHEELRWLNILLNDDPAWLMMLSNETIQELDVLDTHPQIQKLASFFQNSGVNHLRVPRA